MDTDGVAVVKAALQPLCGTLHEVFCASVAQSDRVRSANSLSDSIYNSLGADLTRALAHRELSARDDLGDWQVAGRHHLRGQLLLISGMIRLRFLHEPRSVVPPPGRNLARRAYYRNTPFGQIVAYDAESSNLVAIWHVADPELSTVSIRIVRPVSDKARWQTSETEVDLDFVLPDLGSELSDLKFEQYDEGLMIEFPEDEERHGDDGIADDVG